MTDHAADHRKKRFARRLQVRFWPQGETHPRAAYTTNISATGMFVSTASPLPSGSRCRVEVIYETRGFMVEGVVVHAARVAPVLRQLKESGMGIRFLSIEDLMTELIPEIADQEPMHPTASPTHGPTARKEGASAPPRSAPAKTSAGSSRHGDPPAPRVASNRSAAEPASQHDDKPVARVRAARGAPSASGPQGGSGPSGGSPPTPAQRTSGPPLGSDYGLRYSLTFGSLEELRSVFERDLRNGGAFIPTTKPAELHERLTLDLHLPKPHGRVVSFPARVVHVLESQPGSTLTAGMGLAFNDPDRVVRELEALLKAE
jgi:Tfp pilus assembly protein PilZ